jgi:hypothetical protein
MLLAVNWEANILGSAIPSVTLPELTGIGGLEMLELEQPTETTSNEDSALALANAPPEAEFPEPVTSEANAQPADSDAVHFSETSLTTASDSTTVDTRSGSRNLLWLTLAAVGIVAAIVFTASLWLRPTS